MEIMSKVKYVFANKINETEETGIIEVYSAKILCFCDEESSKFIIDRLLKKHEGIKDYQRCANIQKHHQRKLQLSA